MTVTALNANQGSLGSAQVDFGALLQTNPLKDKKNELARLKASLIPQGSESDLSGNEIGRIKDRIWELEKEIAVLEAAAETAPSKYTLPAGSNLPGRTETKGGNTFYIDN